MKEKIDLENLCEKIESDPKKLEGYTKLLEEKQKLSYEYLDKMAKINEKISSSDISKLQEGYKLVRDYFRKRAKAWIYGWLSLGGLPLAIYTGFNFNLRDDPLSLFVFLLTATAMICGATKAASELSSANDIKQKIKEGSLDKVTYKRAKALIEKLK